ncbi:hypothetical protein TNCV_995041 [Trichonephila clavipes]|nr:hypothetical protein TNCV_995041 [Trichonephila clavipes]
MTPYTNGDLPPNFETFLRNIIPEIVQVLIVRAQVPPSREETGRQNWSSGNQLGRAALKIEKPAFSGNLLGLQCSRSISQELKIDHKTVLNPLRKVGFKKKLHIWGRHQLTPKNMIDRINGKEGSTVYLMELERNHLLGIASAWPNTKFRSLLSTTGPFEASD